MTPRDTFGRPLGSLRLSVTDRCNLRCAYCMPEAEYVWLPRSSLLTFEEIERLARIFASLGASKVRLTGGEPLLRRALPDLVRRLAAHPDVDDLALTTNGLLLSRFAPELRAAGLGRLTVSLDTLRRDRYRALARFDRLEEALAGIRAARAAGFRRIKINTVVMRGINDDELFDLLAFGRDGGLEVRFIEYMDVGGATRWAMERVVSRAEILERMADRYGPVHEVPDQDPVAPADRFVLPDGTVFGIVSSTTAPFCRSCDRSRLTADGIWYLCLYAEKGIDLRAPLRAGASDDDLARLIAGVWRNRRDRGAEERATLPARSTLVQLEGLRADPHREMHTRGG